VTTLPTGGVRQRREPPAFRRVEVAHAHWGSPYLRRVTLQGADLAGFDSGLPASSARLLLPPSHGSAVVLPAWNGNEFLHADGSRPLLRTVTPLHFDPVASTLDVEIVLHGSGPLSGWAATARPGDPAAISGTGRGYEIDPGAAWFLLAGDESALPAIGTLLAALPATAAVAVIAEVAQAGAEIDLPTVSASTLRWVVRSEGAPPGEGLVQAVTSVTLEPGTKVWAGGEAAAMQRLRRLFFEERGVPRGDAVIRGYWKHGRAGGDDL
jgi:NADPH-dependent ferric siderophore reductase